jgi:hypothetical protein
MPVFPNPPYHTPDHNNPGWLEWFRTHKHRPVAKFIYPTSATISGGFGTISSGTVADLATLNLTSLNINETATAPGIRLDVVFSSAAIGRNKPIGVVTRCMYDGNTAHDLFVGAYDYRNAVITRTHTIVTGTSWWRDLSWEFPDPTYFYNTAIGQGCTVRFEHPSNGTTSHILRIDYCALLYLEDE